MESYDAYNLAITVAFGFGGRIGEYVSFLGYGVVPDDSADEGE